MASALGYTSGGSPVTTEQLSFGYDAGWNMTNRAVNGVASYYYPNDLNQATNIAGLNATYDGNGNRVYQVYYSSGPQSYDFVYDDENRLISASTDTTYTPTGSRWKTEWVYDGLGRARIRKEYVWSGSWYPNTSTFYVYDGMRVVQERSTSGAPGVGYTRGLDLSGTFEAAGGIGGLLARSHGYSGGTWSTHNLYHADGLGNVTFMLDSGNQRAAAYRYDAYGRTISSSGSLSQANLYRFSSKEIHSNSGFYYYGFRFYDPNSQRWLNKDPIGESGGVNLYEFAQNDAVDRIDIDGRFVPAPVLMPPLVLNPIGGTIAVTIGIGAIGGKLIDAGAAIIWPDPGSAPLPMPTRPTACAQRGKGNVSYDEILDEAYQDPDARKNKDKLCEKLKELMDKYRKAGDFEKYEKAKSTFKDKCRGWRG